MKLLIAIVVSVLLLGSCSEGKKRHEKEQSIAMDSIIGKWFYKSSMIKMTLYYKNNKILLLEDFDGGKDVISEMNKKYINQSEVFIYKDKKQKKYHYRINKENNLDLYENDILFGTAAKNDDH